MPHIQVHYEIYIEYHKHQTEHYELYEGTVNCVRGNIHLIRATELYAGYYDIIKYTLY